MSVINKEATYLLTYLLIPVLCKFSHQLKGIQNNLIIFRKCLDITWATL